MQDTLPTYGDKAAIGGQPQFAMDARLHVTFHRAAVMNPFKSSQEGRPIYDEQDFVTIIIPGDKRGTVVDRATREYQGRFPKQWDAYQRGLEQATTGTPLEVWPQMTVGLVAELKAMHVTTVEQLAEMPDNLAQRIMGSHSLRQRAKAFLEVAAGDAQNSKMAAELQKRDDEILALKNQMEAFMKAQQQAQSAKVTK